VFETLADGAQIVTIRHVGERAEILRSGIGAPVTIANCAISDRYTSTALSSGRTADTASPLPQIIDPLKLVKAVLAGRVR
jgi:hypothetical protein